MQKLTKTDITIMVLIAIVYVLAVVTAAQGLVVLNSGFYFVHMFRLIERIRLEREARQGSRNYSTGPSALI